MLRLRFSFLVALIGLASVAFIWSRVGTKIVVGSWPSEAVYKAAEPMRESTLRFDPETSAIVVSNVINGSYSGSVCRIRGNCSHLRGRNLVVCAEMKRQDGIPLATNLHATVVSSDKTNAYGVLLNEGVELAASQDWQQASLRLEMPGDATYVELFLGVLGTEESDRWNGSTVVVYIKEFTIQETPVGSEANR